jgi:replicative DNA helicase
MARNTGRRSDPSDSMVPVIRPGEVEPPSAPEAEEGVLGAILVDNHLMATAAGFVRDEDFFSPANAKVMSAMMKLFDRQIGIDPVTVANALREQGELEAVGGPAFLGRLIAKAASSVAVDYYAAIVRDKAAVRRMIATASTIVSEGYASELDPREYLDRAEQRLFAAGEARMHGKVRTFDEALDDALVRIQGLYERREHVTGVPTRYPSLDRRILGFQPSDLVIIAARPSMGKTSFALNLALNAALSDRHTLFVSLEMGEAQLVDRLLCIQAGIDSNRLRSGFIAAEELRMLHDRRQEMRGTPLYIDDSSKSTVLELRARARRMRYAGKLDMVMIDYLQLMEPSDKRVSREQQISEISRSLKAMAKELHIPVIALSQLSRAPETRPGKDKRPLLSDLRESGAIEQDADVVMFLYRPEYYEKEETKEEDRRIMEVIIAKQRNGPTGTVRLRFFPDTMRVAIAEEHDQFEGSVLRERARAGTLGEDAGELGGVRGRHVRALLLLEGQGLPVLAEHAPHERHAEALLQGRQAARVHGAVADVGGAHHGLDAFLDADALDRLVQADRVVARRVAAHAQVAEPARAAVPGHPARHHVLADDRVDVARDVDAVEDVLGLGLGAARDAGHGAALANLGHHAGLDPAHFARDGAFARHELERLVVFLLEQLLAQVRLGEHPLDEVVHEDVALGHGQEAVAKAAHALEGALAHALGAQRLAELGEVRPLRQPAERLVDAPAVADLVEHLAVVARVQVVLLELDLEGVHGRGQQHVQAVLVRDEAVRLEELVDRGDRKDRPALRLHAEQGRQVDVHGAAHGRAERGTLVDEHVLHVEDDDVVVGDHHQGINLLAGT